MASREGSQKSGESSPRTAPNSPAASHCTTPSSEDTFSFDFYMKFTKPLILNLANPNDKNLAASWVQKLKDDSSSVELRTDYLKLFLFVLHRGKLSGPFLHHPGDDQLEDLPDGDKIINVARNILQAEHEENAARMQERIREGGDFPPYQVELSADMLQYASTQAIPQFGAHLYYAISQDPIHAWDNIETGVLPAELLADSAKNSRKLSTMSMKSKSKSLLEAETKASKTPPKPKPVEVVKPVSPQTQNESCPGRRPITWGSNLLNVADTQEESDEPENDEEDDSCKCETNKSMSFGSPRNRPLQSTPQGRSPHFVVAPVSPGRQGGSPSFRQDMSFQRSRSSPASRSDTTKSAFDLLNTSMPQELHDFLSESLSGCIKSPRSPFQKSIDNLMDTSMPGDFDRSMSKSPITSPSKNPKSPKPSTPLDRVRHISMSSRDMEAKSIIEEANKLLEEQELRVQKSSKSPKTPPRKSPKHDEFGDSESPKRTPQQRVRTPIRSSPPYDMTPSLRRQSPGTPDTPRKGKRTFADLFPDVEDTDTDDNFLFGEGEDDIDLNEVNYLDDSLNEDLEKYIRQIQQEYAIEAGSLPIKSGVSATTPSLPTSPIRRNEYGVNFPILDDEDMPDLFNLSLSPASKARVEQRRQQSPVRDEFGLIQLASERKSPSPRKAVLLTTDPQSPRTPKQKTPIKDMTPSPKTPSPRKLSPTVYAADDEDEEKTEMYEKLYDTLISIDGPRQRTPKTPCSDLPLSMTPTKPFSLGWVTPPHLKIDKEVQRTPSPSIAARLGPARRDDYLFNEAYPDLLPPETPPKGPEPRSYEEYIDPFNQDDSQDNNYIALTDEEEPLGAKLEAHEWHPYKPRQFSIKVGARAKNVVLPRKSAPPNIETISEEAEYYYLNSPHQSPARPVEIDFNAPYMLQSSRRDQQTEARESSSPQSSPRKSPTRSPAKSPQKDKKTTASQAQMILDEVQEHLGAQIEDPCQKALLQHVANVVKAVDNQQQATPQSPKTPQSSPKTPARTRSSPQQQNISGIGSPRTPPRSQQSQTKRTSPRMGLEMATPPRTFAEVEMIDASTPPKSPMKYPTPKKQRSPRFDFSAPVQEFMPEYGPPEFEDTDDLGILGESFPLDTSLGTPKQVVQTTDICQRDSHSQTMKHIEKRVNQTWPPARRMQRNQNSSIQTEGQMATPGRSVRPLPKNRNRSPSPTKRTNTNTGNQTEGEPEIEETILEELQVSTPSKTNKLYKDSTVQTKQIQKKINIEQANKACDTEPIIPYTQRYNTIYVYNSPPPSPLPEDLMGTEAPVHYTPRQYIMDEEFSNQQLQSPMRLPVTFPGWSTPEHLKIDKSDEVSPPHIQLPLWTRQPRRLEFEPPPELYDEPYSPESADGRQFSPNRSDANKTPLHKTCVTKVYQNPNGTTTTTVETLEETSLANLPPQTEFSTPRGRQMSPNFLEQTSPPQMPGYEEYAEMTYTPPPPQAPQFSPQRRHEIPQNLENYASPGHFVGPPQVVTILGDTAPPPLPDFINNLSRMANSPQAQDFHQQDQANSRYYAQPQMYDQQQANQLGAREVRGIDRDDYSDFPVYNPPPQSPPTGPYAHLTSPSQYKTPEYKKTIFIHEEMPLYDRIEKTVEDVIYEPDPVPPANEQVTMPYTLISPPRPEYFDVIDYDNNRPGIEQEYMDNLYSSPQQPQPESTNLDAEQWADETVSDLQISGGGYEPLNLEDFSDMNQTPEYVYHEQHVQNTPEMAYEQERVQFDMAPQFYSPGYNQNAMPQYAEPTTPRNVTGEAMYQNSLPPQSELEEQHTTTTTTTVTEEIYYDEGNSSISGRTDTDPQRYTLQWDSPPREELPTYEPYVPPSMFRPMTPPTYVDNAMDPGVFYEDEPVWYGSPRSPNAPSEDQCYSRIEDVSLEFYQSP